MNTAEFSAAKKLSVYGHHRAEILLHQLRMVVHRLGERAEDHARLLQRLLKVVATETLSNTASTATWSALDGVRIDARQDRPLLQRDAELLVGLQQLGSTSSRLFGPGFFFGAE